MKEKVIAVAFNTPIKISPFSGETILTEQKHVGIEMYTGIRAGFLTLIFHQQELDVPFSNCNGIKREISTVK